MVRLRGCWLHRFPIPHTFPLGSSVGLGAVSGPSGQPSRALAKLTSDDRYVHAARRPSHRCVSRAPPAAWSLVWAAIRSSRSTRPIPPSFVLNGFMFALWGCYDVALGSGASAQRAPSSRDSKRSPSNLDRFDTGYWSRYDLYPHRVANIASLAYHQLHIDQLRAMALLTDRDVFDEVARRFASYRNAPLNVARATARKVVFRLAVPRTLH